MFYLNKFIKKLYTSLSKNVFNYIVYISISFLLYNLIKNNYLNIPDISSYTAFIFSIFFLFLSFIFQALNWKNILKSDIQISNKNSISSVGLTKFTKYIPGKIMIIIGKALYISEKYKYSKKILASRSLEAQFIVLWLGLIFGSVPFFSIESFEKYQLYYFLLLIVFSLFIFTKTFHFLGEKIISIFTKKDIKIPKLDIINTLKALPSFICFWISLTLAFYFFVNALTPEPVSFWIGFTFPLAATLGIITLIAPGGIGAREGVLVILLKSYGLDLATATTISVASRLWYLLGEVFIFVVGLVLDRTKNNNK